MKIRRVAVFPVVACLLTLGAAPAVAVPESAVAGGSVGAVDAVFDGDSVDVPPLAECSTDGAALAQSDGLEVDDFVEFGDGESTCSLDDVTGVATADVSGDLFRLDVLRSHGGPRIRLTDFTASCETTETGSSASFHIGGISGIEVPEELPPNYSTTIPAQDADAPPLARVTLNESIVPSPPDGSMTVNIMRIQLFPEGSPDPASETSGELVVGSVSCAPF